VDPQPSRKLCTCVIQRNYALTYCGRKVVVLQLWNRTGDGCDKWMN
jgi:hypothetical protein